MSWYLPDFLTGKDSANEAAGAAADAKRKELNAAKRAERGEAWYAETVANDVKSEGIADGTGRTSDEFIADGFAEGFDDGVTSIRDTIGSAVSTLNPLRLIPWNVWLIGGVILFFYMGGGTSLLGSLKGKSK